MKRILCILLCTLTLLLFGGCQPSLSTAADIKVMSWNVLNPAWGGGPVEMRSEAFLTLVSDNAPDILGVQEAASSWHEAFENLPAQYAPINAKTATGKDALTTFLYNTDTLTLIDSGIEDLDAGSNIRIVSWAVLEVNGTAARFLITNTHPDSREAECIKHTEQYLQIIQDLRSAWKLPLLSVGDFNAVEKSVSYRLHINDGFTDCKYAEGVDLLNNADSYLLGDYGGRITSGQGSRDHVFFKGDVTPITFKTLTDEGVTTVSDHLPVIAEVTVGK